MFIAFKWVKIPSTYNSEGKARNFHYTLNSLRVCLEFFFLFFLGKWNCEEEKLMVLALWINFFLQTNYILENWLTMSFLLLSSWKFFLFQFMLLNKKTRKKFKIEFVENVHMHSWYRKNSKETFTFIKMKGEKSRGLHLASLSAQLWISIWVWTKPNFKRSLKLFFLKCNWWIFNWIRYLIGSIDQAKTHVFFTKKFKI